MQQKISPTTIAEWQQIITLWMLSGTKEKLTPKDVLLGRDAWTIAHRAGITQLAYKDPSIHDAHIQTALQKIFPNVKFLDKKVF